MKSKRKCEICECVINIKKERIKSQKGKKMDIWTSDEGVYFEEGNCWFCFNDFKAMTDPVFKKYEKKHD